MKVRNMIVENQDLFMDSLEKELCQNGISYVRIDNEIHFLDQIIRFYDYEIDKQLIISMFFLMKEEIVKRTLSEMVNNMDLITPKVEYINFKSFIEAEKFINSKEMIKKRNFVSSEYKVRNKNIQKQESHKVKQMIKRYSN